MSYLIKFWGAGAQEFAELNPHQDSKRDKDNCYYYWFETELEMGNFKKKVHSFPKTIATNEGEGFIRFRTIAKMILVYKGVDYPFEYDFGYGYPEESAGYMFFDGNYSCDCNLSSFIIQKYPNANVDELECGEQIQIKDFEIEYSD